MDGQRAGFATYLSRLDVWALSLSCIIGWGAFVMPGTTFLPVAGPLGTAIAMVVSALITGVIAVNYSYLMARHPGIGGVYVYTKDAFGRGHAFLSAWFLCLSYMALIPQNATALAVIFRALFTQTIEKGIHYQIAGYDMYLNEALISVAVLVAIGILAIHLKPFLQHLLTGLAITFAVGVLATSAIILTRVPLARILSVPGFGFTHPAIAVLSIVVLAPWAFVGFEVISLETAHFRFPVKDSRRLMGLAIALGGLIYIAMTTVAAVVVLDGYATWREYVLELGRFRGYASLPTFNAAQKVLGTSGLMLISVTAVAALLSSVIGFYRATNRILANMADDGILSGRFAKPRFCFLFIMSLSTMVSLLGRNALAWIVDLSSLGAIAGFGYVSAAVAKAARTEGDKTYACLGTLGLAISVVFAFTQLMPRVSVIEPMATESFFLLGLWCLLGFAFFWRTMRVGTGNERAGETVTIYALFVLLFYSALVWFLKSLVGRAGAGLTAPVIVRYSVVFGVLVLLGLLVMVLIASQLKKHQDLLEGERIRAIEGSKAKSQFLFNMSHDIRTPMNAIIGYTNLAQKEDVSATPYDYLEKIESSSQHLLGLINDILEMSRIESGKIELELEPADLCRLIDELYDLFVHQMEQKRIAFSVHTEHVRHRYVWCDENYLNRVLLNLVSNAYKFTPEEGAITVSVREDDEVEEGFGAYELRVKDSGRGMSQEFAERMFNAFERERTSTASRVEGTGLGLAITKSIVDQMGGTIEVITSPGEGTEMIVRVRLQLVEGEKVPDGEEGPAGEEELTDFTGIRALLVEDNEINREIATMILEEEGFEIETAENGQVALDKVAASDPGHYDIILMDIQMPVMDGYEAAQAIRALDNEELSSVPIVAMTANAFKEDEEAAARAGMQGHIAKPLDVDKMLETLSRVLGARPAR